jgi:hypothetical protein
MGEMVTLPPSSISNAALAAFTTGFVRAYLAELLAAVPPEKAVYTATTDGLLTEATPTDLQTTGPLASMFAELRELVAGAATTLEDCRRAADHETSIRFCVGHRGICAAIIDPRPLA